MLRVDGGQAQLINYPATLNWVYRARRDVDLSLTAGPHQITLATSDPALGTAKGEVTLDRVDLTALTDRPPAWRYPAVRADTAGRARYDYDPAQVRLRPAARTTFAVYAPGDGCYDVSVRYAATAGAQVTLGGATVEGAALDGAGGRWRTTTHRLFLAAGINRIGVQATRGAVSLDSLTVTAATTGPRPVRPIEAESARLTGTAHAVQNTNASGGAHVEGAGNGSGNTVTLTGLPANPPGQYVLAIHYANDERGAGHQYNANIISRRLDISVNGQAPARVWFRNTWAWNNFWTLTVPVTLDKTSNTITLSNPSGNAPNLDRVDVAPLLATP